MAKKRKKKPMRTMVQCGDHKWAPGGVVCRHLKCGTATTWIRVLDIYPGQGADCEHDYLCPACMEKLKAERLHHIDLFPICIHCIRDRRQFAAGEYVTIPAHHRIYAEENPHLLPGDHVKVGFLIDPKLRQKVGGEFMFVEVTAVEGDWPDAVYRGELCNRPVFIDPAMLRLGQPIEFRGEHIYQSIHDSPSRPPEEREQPPE